MVKVNPFKSRLLERFLKTACTGFFPRICSMLDMQVPDGLTRSPRRSCVAACQDSCLPWRPASQQLFHTLGQKDRKGVGVKEVVSAFAAKGGGGRGDVW